MTKKLIYNGNSYIWKDQETVLNAMLRCNVTIPFSCRSGICHNCMMKSKSGTPSTNSQNSLPENLVNKGYFLACKCTSNEDLEFELPVNSDLYGRASIHEINRLSESVIQLILEPATSLYYHAGQFINIRKEENGISRSYSLASLPYETFYLESHIKIYPQGEMSQWLSNTAKPGDSLDIQGPLGNCYYRNEFTTYDILLIATGTGLAPLIGVARDALMNNHKGALELYVGSSTKEGLYLIAQLDELQSQYNNFHYHVCISGEQQTEHSIAGRAHDIAFKKYPNLENWIVYLAGNPGMVKSSIEFATQSGVNPDDIYSDPFEFATKIASPADEAISGGQPTETNSSYSTDDKNNIIENPPYPNPDNEMWENLKHGSLLSNILSDFYTLVYEDEKLNGFFEDTTKVRAIEKQYNFLAKVFTGENVYFGEKPLNAHHWMVISNELFDYRRTIMESCLNKNGLPKHLIQRWLDMEEQYRCVIVKEKPWKKFVNGVEYPLDGFDSMVVDTGTVCDTCSSIIEIGETISYHRRLGSVYCQQCMSA